LEECGDRVDGAGLVVAAGLWLERHWRTKAPGQVETPYGVAIAMAAMLALGEPIFNHFA
jgi:Flp pilus assembly protein protease CpaA